MSRQVDLPFVKLVSLRLGILLFLVNILERRRGRGQPQSLSLKARVSRSWHREDFEQRAHVCSFGRRYRVREGLNYTDTQRGREGMWGGRSARSTLPELKME
jgi:hypothetical protein